MEFKHTHTFNFQGALHGMRNPMNSWHKSDSHFGETFWCIGDKDLELAQRLVLAGSEHGKFMRQIFVSADITAPIFWWKEMDTYKVGTTANSTSTMHKLVSKPITEDDFEFTNKNLIIETLDNEWFIEDKLISNTKCDWVYTDYIESIVDMCENLRQKYIETKNRQYWRALIEILPQSYLQTRTWTANYAILRNIYFQRQNHKLKEWHKFCEWIETLPYAAELITLKEKPDEIN